MHSTILLIEDDAQIRKVVAAYLQQEGYRVLTAMDGLAGLALAKTEKPTLVILDLMLPGMDGLEIASWLRSSHDPAISSVYIIMLTARVDEMSRVKGLDKGGDDYVTKPFSPRELVARVRAALRRLESQLNAHGVQVIQHDMLRLDPTYRIATLDGENLNLTTVEFDLLYYLMRHVGRPFTRSELLDITQQDATGDIVAYERTIDAHIKNIRHKLGGAGRTNNFIETVHGVGYRFIA